MSKASEFAKARQSTLDARPKIELQHPHTDNKCLFRVSKDGKLEYHHTSQFTILGEFQGETYGQLTLSAEEALKLADWIQKTFK